jgi:outer membrane protein OmpU
MKSILLASVSAFAFAGAAAADVAWSGSASASYNNTDGDVTTSTEVSLDFAASLAGDWTLSTSGGFTSVNGGDGAWSTGNVSLSDGTSTLTFGSGLCGAAGFVDADDDCIDNATVRVETVMGGASIAVSGNDDGDVEVGVSTSAGGAEIDAGFVVAGDGVQGDYRLSVSTSAGGADIGFDTETVGGDMTYSLSAGMAVGGVDLDFTIDQDQAYTVDASYAMGDLTVSAGITDVQGDYTLGVDYVMGAVSLGLTTNQDSEWEVAVGYSEGAVSADISMVAGEDADITLSYDLGGGATVNAGLVAGETFAGIDYDLGGGASLSASYATAANDDWYPAGSTIAVSFDF